MKTLTEFSGFVLKEAMTKKAALVTEGKSEEEVQAALNEFLKLDETKVGFYKNVVDMTSSRVDRVKRVVVALKAAETEKVPENYIEREGHFYLVEYFPEAGRPQARGGRDDRDDRGGRGKRGDRNDRFSRDGRGPSRDGGRGSPRGERTERAPSADRPQRDPSTPGFVSTGEGVATKPARPPREKRAPRPRSAEPKAPREPRAPRAPRGPKGAGELRLVLKGQSSTTLQGSGQISAPAEATPVTSEQPQA